VFLEAGKRGINGSGFNHILERHEKELFDAEIKTDYELVTILSGIITSKEAVFLGVATDASKRSSSIYAITINNKQLNIVIASNGYIITAYPTTKQPSIVDDDEQPSQWMHI